MIADFHLHSSTADRAKGVFRINTVSSNSVVEANFPVAPNSHTLYLKAHTSNSPISVNLHKTFEGTFSLGSSRWIPPTIQYDPEATDPSGEGRRRKVQYIRPQRGHMSGSVSWSAVERTDLGVVEASTSNSPAHITL